MSGAMRGGGCFGWAGWVFLSLVLGGCQSEASRSQPGVEAWVQRIQEFYRRHQKLPDRLDDLQECFASVEEFQQALRNPVTGDDPGYEYVKPPRGVVGTALADRVVMVYQLRAGQQAWDLPVGYVCGQAGLLRASDITDTVPRWQMFQPPEAPVQVAFPAPPERPQEAHDSSRLDARQNSDSQEQQKPKALQAKAFPPSPQSKDAAVWSYRASFCGLEYMLLGMQSALFYQMAREDPYRLMDMLCEGLTKQQQTELRSREKLRLQDQPVLDVELFLPQYKHQLRVRWCLAGTRLYCLSVTGPEGALNEDNVGKFFQSFRLLEP